MEPNDVEHDCETAGRAWGSTERRELVAEVREEAVWAEASGMLNLARLLRRAAEQIESDGRLT